MIRDIYTSGPVNACIKVPGSKSITNRALICAALAKGESTLHNSSDSDDTMLMANGLNQLGVLVRKSGTSLVVQGLGGHVYAPKFPIPVGNAGTTLRFLVSLAALADREVVFEGSDRMGLRPISDLLDALRKLGTEARFEDMFSRYTVMGGNFSGGATGIRIDKSSQFLSSILMVAPYARDNVRIEVEGDLVSTPYVESTLEVMNYFGVKVERPAERSYVVRAGQRYKPCEFRCEPDASGASYFFAAAAIAGGEVVVEGLGSTARQGDMVFLALLEEMGCEVTKGADHTSVKSSGSLKGIDVDMRSMPDIVPTLAVTALFGSAPTRIRNIAHLQYKESDRLQALVTELEKVGARVVRMDDELRIDPGPLHAALLDTYDDHRIAMSFALIGLRVPGIRVENPECVRKSFPSFWKEFEKLYHKT